MPNVFSHPYQLDESASNFEGVDRGGGGTGIRGAESGMEGRNRGWRGAESGVEGAGIEGAGYGAGSLERFGGKLIFFYRKFRKMTDNDTVLGL